MEVREENEKKKEYLKRYGAAVRAAQILEEELAELRDAKMRPAPIVYDDMPHGTDQKDLSDYAAKWDELVRELQAARYKRITVYLDISQRIEKMEDQTQKNVLRLRYIQGKKWEDICVALGYEWAQMHRVHAKALLCFETEDDIE